MSSNNRMYIDFHVLQTVPPSCVNRDDMGSPKVATYGGVTRARISSQAQKHAMREMFRDIFEDVDCGLRTKHIVKLIADKIASRGANDAEKLAIDALSAAGLKIKDANVGTDALFFLSDAQAEALAELAVQGKTAAADKKVCQAALTSKPSIDMALFGRMVASDPSLNFDACAQVAHAISTHAVTNEYDFFSAVDDMSAPDNAGAGHLGTVEFNSSTLYRYATVNVTELYKLIGPDVINAIVGFSKAFICSMPTGKQNTFANRTLPDDVYVTIRNDQPVNLVGAFEKPVKSRDGNVAASEEKLVAYANKVYTEYADVPESAYVIGNQIAELGKVVSLNELTACLEVDVKKYMEGVNA